ncbi:MAG: T9SS type A sorting domain-containing protein [bacterium]
MKKLILTACLLTGILSYGYSQSLTLSDIDGVIDQNAIIVQSGTPDSVELITYFNVKNIGTKTISVLCKKTHLAMLDSTEITMCWAGGCYPSNINVSPNAQSIEAGQTITDFVGHYTQTAFSHFKSGESVIRWTFFDSANVNDSASVTVKYTTYPLGIDENAARQAMLSNAYPNPASGYAAFSYAVPSGTRGTLFVRDILGSTVETLSLQPGSGKVTLNTMSMNDGIYFCSLLVDGKISLTKKLSVKH